MGLASLGVSLDSDISGNKTGFCSCKEKGRLAV